MDRNQPPAADGSDDAMNDPLSSLCPDDQCALDALADNGYDAARVDDGYRERAERIVTLLTVLRTLPEEDASELVVARTLQRIEDHRRNGSMAPPDELHITSRGGGLPFKLPEMIAIAAMLVICMSVLWPILAHARASARQIACQANLAKAGVGLAAYSADHNGQLPATFARLGDPWWNVNSFDRENNKYAQSNSAHLFVAVRNKYTKLSDLRCPENGTKPIELTADMRDWPDAAHTSYSYQNQYTKDRPRFDTSPTMAVLSDKNPFFRPGDEVKFDMALAPERNSSNHAALSLRGVPAGQNVLLTNGQVTWMETPFFRNTASNDFDNIFHAGANGVDYYTGLEGPADRNDSFLVP